jgi:hypothetical protein
VQWAERFTTWSQGGEPDDLPRICPPLDANGAGQPRDCFVYFIAGDKVRAPAAAVAFLGRLGTAAPLPTR